MEIPYYIFLIIYLVFLGIFLIFAFFNLYHLIRFGLLDFGNIFTGFLYIAVMALILFLSWQKLSAVNWQETWVFNLPALNI